MNRIVDPATGSAERPPSGPRFAAKSPVQGRWVAVLDHVRRDRGLSLNGFRTRCLRRWDVHELLVVCEGVPGAESTWDEVGYLGFGEFTSAGVLAVGDRFCLDGLPFGELIGFDGTHEPNHMNLVLRASELVTGAALGIRLGKMFHFESVREITPR